MELTSWITKTTNVSPTLMDSALISTDCACGKLYAAQRDADKAKDENNKLKGENNKLKGKLNAVKTEPERILRSGNRMIVFWKDGTKMIVKRAEDEPDSDYAAFTAALGIKLFGSNSALKRIIVEAQKPKKKGVNKNGKEGIANK